MTGKIDRRRVLTGGGALIAAAGLAGCTAGGESDPSPSATPANVDLSNWAAVRAQFLLDPQLAHFAAFVMAPHPAPVRAAIEKWRSELDTDPARAVSQEVDRESAVRDAAAGYLGVATDEVALTDSTTMGLGLIYHGLRLEPGDHLLTSTHDFYSTHEALHLAATRAGATVEQIALYDDPAAASVGEIVSRVRAALTPATRVLALTWVHSGTGVKLPVAEIAEVVAAANQARPAAQRILFCLDSIHGLAAEVTKPATMGCDVFISGTHKWLFGPRGTGLVWMRREAWDRITAIIPTFSGPSVGRWLTGEQVPFIFGLDGTPGGYHSFEHRWATTEAFAFHQAIGPDRVQARTRELAARLKDGLAGLPGVKLVTPRDPEVSAGVVCCAVGSSNPADIMVRLREDHGILTSVTPYREQYLRFGTSIVTTGTQVDAAVDALGKLS